MVRKDEMIKMGEWIHCYRSRMDQNRNDKIIALKWFT